MKEITLQICLIMMQNKIKSLKNMTKNKKD